MHVRWHTCQRSTIQNREISGGLLLGPLSVSFCLVPILATRLVLLLKEWALIIMYTYVNGITLILCSSSHLLHNDIHTVIKKTQIELKIS